MRPLPTSSRRAARRTMGCAAPEPASPARATDTAASDSAVRQTARPLDSIEEILPDRFVLQDLLASQADQLMRKYEPSVGRVHEVVRYQAAAVACRLVIHRRNSNHFRKIASAAPLQLCDDCLQTSA